MENNIFFDDFEEESKSELLGMKFISIDDIDDKSFQKISDVSTNNEADTIEPKTDWERWEQRSQPHPRNILDWSTYYAPEFGDRFLYKAPLYAVKGISFYDGYRLMKELSGMPIDFLALNDDTELINFIGYSYPNTVLAAQKTNTVQVAAHEVCCFFEVNQQEDIKLRFKFGSNFISFLRKHKFPITSVDSKTFHTTVTAVQQFFQKKLSQRAMMEFVLKTINFDAQLAHGNSEKGKLESFFRSNKIEGFVYKTVSSNQEYCNFEGKMNSGLLQLNRIDESQITEITGLETKDEKKFLATKQNNEWTLQKPLIAVSNTVQDSTITASIDNADIKTISAVIQKQFAFSKLAGNQKQFEAIAAEIEQKLANPFYKNLGLCVNLSADDENLSTSKPQSAAIDGKKNIFAPIKNGQPKFQKSFSTTGSPCEITLNIHIDAQGKVSIKHQASPSYLEEHVEKWNTEVKKRGLENEVNVEELRQQVLSDFVSAETERSFYETFVQNAKALLSENVGGYIEAIQATQKVAKNVWAEGTINQTTWLSADAEHQRWPQYMQLNATVGGATDGVIDEIVGIPMAIKGIYSIATDEQQREAFSKMFTQDGARQLIDGLKNEAKQTLNDNDRLQHTAGVTVVAVGAAVLGIGLFTKTGKVADALTKVTDKITDFVNPKALAILEKIKKGTRTLDNDKAIKEFSEEVGEDFLNESVDELSDIALSESKDVSLELWKKLRERGQKFNKIVRDLSPPKYDHFEITIEHPTLKYTKGKDIGKPRKFVLDSYNDGLEIVSRKATDFNKIQLKTFDGYCKELLKKYPVGAKIVADNIEIKGKLLKGKLKIEVPKSNELSKRLQEFKEIAKKYEIEIVFEAE